MTKLTGTQKDLCRIRENSVPDFAEDGSLELRPAGRDHVLALMDWFGDGQALRNWGGPSMRFPCSPQSFLQDCRWQELPSYVLLQTGQLVGFGQYYLRAGRCHLGRLVISPDYRGRRLATTLIRLLVKAGSECLAVEGVSLFVLAHNLAAIRCYQRLGFTFVTYPEPTLGMEDCLYMVADKSDILG